MQCRICGGNSSYQKSAWSLQLFRHNTNVWQTDTWLQVIQRSRHLPFVITNVNGLNVTKNLPRKAKRKSYNKQNVKTSTKHQLTASHQGRENGCVRRVFQDSDDIQSIQCTAQYQDWCLPSQDLKRHTTVLDKFCSQWKLRFEYALFSTSRYSGSRLSSHCRRMTPPVHTTRCISRCKDWTCTIAHHLKGCPPKVLLPMAGSRPSSNNNCKKLK